MPKSTATATARKSKPAKPHEGFPLFPHATKRLVKKIRGKLHYSGPWAEPEKALELYQEQRDDLHAGHTPRANRDGLTAAMLVDSFLDTKRHLADTRELTAPTGPPFFQGKEFDAMRVAAARARKLYDEQAKERMSAGRPKKGVEHLPHLNSDSGKARDQAGKILGVSGKSVDLGSDRDDFHLVNEPPARIPEVRRARRRHRPRNRVRGTIAGT
jgi:hypothetical protein